MSRSLACPSSQALGYFFPSTHNSVAHTQVWSVVRADVPTELAVQTYDGPILEAKMAGGAKCHRHADLYKRRARRMPNMIAKLEP